MGGFVKKLIAASFLLFTLIACSSVTQPTPTEIPTFTAVLDQTVNATQTLTVTSLPPGETPDEVSGLPSEGQPASEWNGIPIMPGAITGEGDEESYVFTVKATPQQVQEYYQLELGRLGWQLLSQEEGASSVILLFTNHASETLTVSILSKGDEALVLLVK